MIRILIVDDHAMVRRGLRFFLEAQADMEVVGEAADGGEAVREALALAPDVALMDLVMPNVGGIEAIRMLASKAPEVKILLLTSFSDQAHIRKALDAGAAGFEMKDIEPDELAEAIRHVAAGRRHVRAAGKIAFESAAVPPHLAAPLSEREREVLKELIQGKSNREIAKSLFVSEKTVKTHLTNLFAKLQVHDRTQAVLYAVNFGMFKK